MARYIDAETLANEINMLEPFELNDDEKCIVFKTIQQQPTANVVEVRHGEWHQNPHCSRIYYCSICGRHIEDGSNSNNPTEFFPYCHCGAKMNLR